MCQVPCPRAGTRTPEGKVTVRVRVIVCSFAVLVLDGRHDHAVAPSDGGQVVTRFS